MRKNLLLLIVIFSLCTFSGCSSTKPVTVSDFALNTFVSITLYGKSNEEIAKNALAKVKYYENIFSKTQNGSQVYTLNDLGFLSYADKDLYELILKAQEYSKMTDGSLDISIGPLTSLWDITGDTPKVPNSEDIDNALTLVDYNNIRCMSDNTIMLDSDMKVDLGAIAKGFIADKIRNYLLEQGVTNGIINLGGNILCLGKKPNNSNYVVGIQKPFSEISETILSLDISDMSVVTSGVYERYFKENDTIYHHIIDPSTGYPATSGVTSVTIISKDSLTGDCLSTACLIMGKDKALKLINSMENVYAIIIDDQSQIYYSDGARSFLH